jgi:hypothetical protein
MAIVVSLSYSNTLEAQFSFDDTTHIHEKVSIRISSLNIESITKATRENTAPTRPVAFISFAMNYYFHQYNVFGYHLVNIFIHFLRERCFFS